ncbi:MAG: rod-binding protein [Alphaproteobacteria bacterium]|nr:rod-binding protein [Alphaproteobacteria bacterium]
MNDDLVTSSALLSAKDPAKAAASVSTKNAGRPVHGLNLERAREKAEEFEAVFISQMMAPMFENLSTDGFFGGGQGEKVFRTLLIDEYGKVMAKAGGIGLADSVLNEMIRIQEAGK